MGYPSRRVTLPEALDAAQTGEEFGKILGGLFATLEKFRDKEERDADGNV